MLSHRPESHSTTFALGNLDVSESFHRDDDATTLFIDQGQDAAIGGQRLADELFYLGGGLRALEHQLPAGVLDTDLDFHARILRHFASGRVRSLQGSRLPPQAIPGSPGSSRPSGRISGSRRRRSPPPTAGRRRRPRPLPAGPRPALRAGAVIPPRQRPDPARRRLPREARCRPPGRARRSPLLSYSGLPACAAAAPAPHRVTGTRARYQRASPPAPVRRRTQGCTAEVTVSAVPAGDGHVPGWVVSGEPPKEPSGPRTPRKGPRQPQRDRPTCPAEASPNGLHAVRGRWAHYGRCWTAPTSGASRSSCSATRARVWP